ncbi:MBL fold metallo-hydrolase [Roseinatronobacter alkalisoli]|uniref:MBL fold metallo-hydrolase n=1 Tax=Roseinatronobacter alkalisoli TaxID=3028235 RepID=A0ABT5T308_9RHOB|nr:MBL fold metallo-hydrolase [Roseinatronobacter sp. HJB301]MDD7969495.1 MBL fold metallo-hydrolase [Roseinatronobacter sp. HJB301]
MSRSGLRYPFPTPPPAGQVTCVADRVFWLRLALPMALDHVNAFVLDDGDGWTLFDTGFDDTATRDTWASLLAGPLQGKPVRRVIASHHHPDHIGLAGWFQAQGANLWTSRTAWLMARMMVLDEQHRPNPETLEFWKRSGMEPGVLAQRAQERPFNFCDRVAPLPLGYHRVADGDVLHAGGRDWVVRLGQGHAPDQITLWSQSCNLVLGADQLLPSISANLGVYATEPDADPVAEWLASCVRFKEFARDDQLVLPGHKLPFTGLPLRLNQMIENHIGALNRLHQHLSEPRKAGACFGPLFKREITGAVYGLALVEAVAHLNHLTATGRARRWMGEDGVWLWQAV